MFQRKALLLSFLISAVGGSSVETMSFHEVADIYIQHDPNPTDLHLKVNLFRPAFTTWMEIHDKVYETVEEEVQKMLVWVKNHGTLC